MEGMIKLGLNPWEDFGFLAPLGLVLAPAWLIQQNPVELRDVSVFGAGRRQKINGFAPRVGDTEYQFIWILLYISSLHGLRVG